MRSLTESDPGRETAVCRHCGVTVRNCKPGDYGNCPRCDRPLVLFIRHRPLGRRER